ncbi:YcaO-like family protein [Halalkalicoccus jeotgali]|uniref:YcaO-like family domain protein n=1 Tax=Halalkalicoccus jeotgali (strain DSM 18796 / CECT 7217 / JCM 14584 / KCTC 4019 / B3) TaxID=795797 RepID=D8J369_HALJB|nr:YcaO-like family protein [Halalkalicoccus jeotgali]ADJ15176.1 YcaO-like family domain protein [Halalkalicoccus jeotgali B3]ELY35104.1 YcaO-like family domain-containing protein [Halalkalicoccus jeotgali B3]
MDVSIGIAGSGPAADAIAAALSDADVVTQRGPPETLSEHHLGVVVGSAGDDVFATVDGSREKPWVGVELGGIGGYSIEGVEASVAGFAPETGCYRCLQTRIEANESRPEESDHHLDPDPVVARLIGAIAGYRIVEALRGKNERLFGHVIELPYTERRFLEVPTCDRCGERSSPPVGEGESRSVTEAISRAEPGVDERVGIVRSVGEVASFPVPYYLATSAETEGFSDASAANQAAGVAADWDAAYMKALGEAFERYAAGVYRTEWFEYARPDGMANAIAPQRFVGAEATDEEIPWVAGERLDTGESASLPAEFVHFPPPEKRFGPAITTGLGLGNTRTEALLSGLYEVIERDATMLAWYSTFEPLELDVEDETFRTLERRAAGEGLSVTPLLVTQDVDVPVVAVAVHREGDWPRFALGSDADLDAGAAARSALCEALQNWMELRSMGPEAAGEQSGWIGRYASLPDPAREFLDVSGRVEADAVGDRSLGPKDELGSLVERVQDVGMAPYAAWVTPSDIRTLGFEATRVLVPAAQPLFTAGPVFGERAEAVPRSMGFEPRLERDPHPYP